MLNHGAKKAAMKRLKDAVRRHEEIADATKTSALSLYAVRCSTSSKLVPEVEAYVNELANSPKEFAKSVAEYRVEYRRFTEVVEEIQTEARRATQVGGGVAGAGALAGIGVAAFGPTAAMAIATTFGTASTGAAISALSGAVATNAALAWLGGGALAAGGGGMAAGNALLALAGPVGWGIGGLALVGGVALAHVRNGQVAERATQEAIGVEGEVRALEKARGEIENIEAQTRKHAAGIEEQLVWLRRSAPRNYKAFNVEQRRTLAALINNIKSLSQLLQTQVA